jgi:transposase
MAQNFIACDRGQGWLMPPSLADRVPGEHLVWSVLGAVDQMDLSAFYGAYRADGHGRPAYDPAMMVALLLYAYARGNRSSRGIERACVEDVAYRVITANVAPDHSTIAEFRRRHEDAVAELFVQALALCGEAGLVQLGVIAIDGTKLRANASREQNRRYEALVAEILRDAEQTDREEDERYGEARGDELPERLRTREGRRAALAKAKERLAGRTFAVGESDPVDVGVELEIDEDQAVASAHGRKGWLREGRRWLERRREGEQQPVPRSRAERLLEAEQRLAEDHAVELAAHAAFEVHHAQRVRSDGRRFAPTAPYEPPAEPAGEINLSDPDSRMIRVKGLAAVQGYNAQAAVTEDQIIVGAEITLDAPDFGHLQPVFDAALRDLTLAGISDRPEVVIADAGYWHQRQMERIIADGTAVLVPPDSSLREQPRPGWTGGFYDFMRRVLASDRGRELYRQRKPTIEPVFGHTKHNRKIDRFQRRGRSAVRSEWRLIAATHNLLKLHKHWISPATA